MADNFDKFLPDWQIGTLTLSANSTAFTATDALLTFGSIQQGDFIISPDGRMLVIESITDDDNGVLSTPCPPEAAGTFQTRIRYQSDNSRYTGQTAALRRLLSGGNLLALSKLTGDADKGIMFTGAGTAGTFDLTEPAREVLAGNSQEEMITKLGLLPVQSDIMDATENRIMRTGAFGVGATNTTSLSNFDSYDIPVGFYRLDPGATGVWPSGEFAATISIEHYSPEWCKQTLTYRADANFGFLSGATFIRVRHAVNGTWSAWSRITNGIELISSDASTTGVNAWVRTGLSAYRQIKLSIDAATTATGDNISVQVSSDNGASWISTVGNYTEQAFVASGTNTVVVQATPDRISSGALSSSSEQGGIFAEIEISEFNQARRSMYSMSGSRKAPTTFAQELLMRKGIINVLQSFNAIRVLAGTGTMARFSINLWGVR